MFGKNKTKKSPDVMKLKATKFSPSFHLQVGECQKEGSGSGKQGSRGRGDLWVLSQGGKRRLRRDGRKRGRLRNKSRSVGRGEESRTTKYMKQKVE